MMDANLIMLILTLVTVGFLALNTLWGFLAGVRRELQCLAVFVFLFAVAWLLFSDPIAIMDARVPGMIITEVDKLLGRMISGTDSFFGFPSGVANLRETCVFLISKYVPQLAPVLADATSETYNFLINFIGSIIRIFCLLFSTMFALSFATFIRVITKPIFVSIRVIKRSREKSNAILAAKYGVDINSLKNDRNNPDSVVVAEVEEDTGETVITISKNARRSKGYGRLWGAFIGLGRGLFLTLLFLLPVAGLMSIVDEVEKDTVDMVVDIMYGSENQTTANINGFDTENIFEIV